jgi:hypothetical protein
VVLNPITAGGALVLSALPLAGEAPADAVGSPPTDLIGYLLQGGPFAAVLALILFDKLTPTGERNRLREEVKENKQIIAELNKQLLDVLPPLTEMLPLLRELADSRIRDREYDQPRRGA